MKSRQMKSLFFISWKWATILLFREWHFTLVLLLLCVGKNLFNIRLFNGYARLRHPRQVLHNDKLFERTSLHVLIRIHCCSNASSSGCGERINRIVAFCCNFNHLKSIHHSQKADLRWISIRYFCVDHRWHSHKNDSYRNSVDHSIPCHTFYTRTKFSLHSKVFRLTPSDCILSVINLFLYLFNVQVHL